MALGALDNPSLPGLTLFSFAFDGIELFSLDILKLPPGIELFSFVRPKFTLGLAVLELSLLLSSTFL
jgi:hypothetical protein